MTEAAPDNRQTFVTFTDWARARAKWILDPMGASLAKAGVHPNVLTFVGLVGNILGAVLLSQGRFTLGGIVIFLMAPIDALDGATARAHDKPSRWGAFIDSTTDRWTEAVTMLGLIIYYSGQGDEVLTVLVLLALVGSLMVSYTRARAEALGFDAKVGLMSRLERYVILVPALIFGRPEWALWILAALANLTALQRILHVRKQWYAAANDSNKNK
ncbi:MAG: CDP-alcohol phosphatidyltransferase family protein [Anaerolineales bacterium]